MFAVRTAQRTESCVELCRIRAAFTFTEEVFAVEKMLAPLPRAPQVVRIDASQVFALEDEAAAINLCSAGSR